MSETQTPSTHDRWAQLRFAVVGPLLAAPPSRGELRGCIEELANKTWNHPTTDDLVRFGASTIERWYYSAKNAGLDPVGELRRQPRRDLGKQRGLNPSLRQALHDQYASHPYWSVQLHVDNLVALVERHPELGPMRSYGTIRRYMKANNLLRQRRRRRHGTDAEKRAERRREGREVRSYEADHAHGLWHLDFHHGSRKVLVPSGAWVTPILLGVLDDHSRLCCHVQWYLHETAENLVHGLMQALLKRGLPRSLMTDNGSAMVAAETREGLQRLSIVHELTLPHSPYQNAKQEVFWAQVEGRLMAMLEGEPEVTLAQLNQATQAWAEMGYHRKKHRELKETPLARFANAASVGRDCPAINELRLCFTKEVTRAQRKSDGTITLEGVRLEVPSRYRHLERVRVRYASWDLGHVYLVDGRSGTVLCRLFPLDKSKNADGRRAAVEPVSAPPQTPAPCGVAPLLERMIDEYRSSGLPPAYLVKDEASDTEEEAS